MISIHVSRSKVHIPIATCSLAMSICLQCMYTAKNTMGMYACNLFHVESCIALRNELHNSFHSEAASPVRLVRPTFQQVVGLIPRLHRHPCVAKYTCVYDVQLLAIWHIPLFAVVLLLSLACGDSPPAHVVDPPPCACTSDLVA